MGQALDKTYSALGGKKKPWGYARKILEGWFIDGGPPASTASNGKAKRVETTMQNYNPPLNPRPDDNPEVTKKTLAKGWRNWSKETS